MIEDEQAPVAARQRQTIRSIQIPVLDRYTATMATSHDPSSPLVLVTLVPVAPPRWVFRSRLDLDKQAFIDPDPRAHGLIGHKLPDLAEAIAEALRTLSDGVLSDGVYYSQVGQDKFVDEFFGGRRGVFVDVGAYDGVTLSNTAFLEQTRGWTGLCVEPMEDRFEELKRNRVCACVRAAVADRDGEVDFLRVDCNVVNTEMLSGVVEAYTPAHLQRVRAEAGTHRGSPRITRVPARRLDALLREAWIDRVDYVSIDTEGSELAALRSFDPKEFGVKLLTIENNERGDGRLEQRMDELGYKLLTTLAHDDVYVPR